MPASPIRKLMPLADEAKKRGVKVLHLNIGQPDLETPEPMRRRLAQLKDKVYAYSPSNGTPEYLDFLHAYYGKLGIALEPDEILATTGGSEALLFAFMACADPGGEILTVEPFYTNYRSFAAMAGLTLHPIVTRGEDGFHLPARAEWEKALTPKTRLVLLCNPNNPTGTVYSREELVRVAEFCRDHGLFFVSDEVYREFLYDGREVRQRPLARGVRGRGRRRRLPLEALLGLRHPARRPRHAERRRRGGLQPHGAGSPLAAGPRPVHRARRAGARAGVLPRRRDGIPEEARHALRRACRRSPASFSASPRELSTSWRACPFRTATTSRPGS